MSFLRAIIASILLLLLAAARAGAGEKIGGRLNAVLAESPAGTRFTVWVMFSDKGGHEVLKAAIPLSVVSDRSIVRRLNVLPPERVVDYTDLPIEEEYVSQVTRGVLEVRQRSKWFNAVSVVATKDQIGTVEQLPCVRSIELVARFRRNPESEPVTQAVRSAAVLTKAAATDNINYGPSFGQLNQIGVPAVHATGNHAEGVIVGMFDNGVRLLTHEAFDSLRPRIIATNDYVDHKTSVVPNNPNTDTRGFFGGHGVNTLSTIGGFVPGQLIGPAFGASFILARTENDSSETPIEEDNWVAAIEWADSLGVQVTSTSLGSLTFDAPYVSLTWQDMNGRTAIISQAATMAARKGIVVCNSAGNEGHNGSHNTLIAPADADSILSVGAVNSSSVLASFSSNGPTVDGRIKPDVLAQGMGVYAASSVDTAGFSIVQGTSFSCPLAAGAAALLVKAFPNATPMQIINALRTTASNAASPNNLYGWGIINAMSALNSLNTASTGTPEEFSLFQNYPNPFNPFTTIRYQLPTDSYVTLRVYDVIGREVRTLVNAKEGAGSHTARFDGSALSSGVYFYELSANGSVQSRKMVLLK